MWTLTLGEILADFYWLAMYPGDVTRIFVYLESEPLRRFMVGAGGQSGISLDTDRITLIQSAVDRLPPSAAKVVGPALASRRVEADRICAIRVDDDLCMYVYDVSAVAPESGTTGPVTPDRVRSNARREILAAVDDITTRSGSDRFTLGDVVAEMRRWATGYAESTIRTMVSAHMCADAPDNAGTTYDDFERPERGVYRLIRKPSWHEFENERVDGPAELQDLLRWWVDESDRATLAPVPPFGGRAVVHVRLGGNSFHLNADTKRDAVRQFLDAAVRAGGADRLPWWVIATRNGQMRLVTFRLDRQPVVGWYAYLDQAMASEGPVGQALAPE